LGRLELVCTRVVVCVCSRSIPQSMSNDVEELTVEPSVTGIHSCSEKMQTYFVLKTEQRGPKISTS
jgi:hypothetical protein